MATWCSPESRSVAPASPKRSARPPPISPATTRRSSPARSSAPTAAPGCEPMQRDFEVSTRRKFEVVDITEQVARIVAESELDEGICSVYVPHATAAIVINENDDPNIGDD